MKQKSGFHLYTIGDRVFLTINGLLLLAVLIAILYPLAYIVSASFSGGISVMSLSLLPRKLSLLGYRTVFNYKDIWTGYANSLYYTLFGTLVSLIITTCCAYPLSRRDFRFRNVMMLLCMITMYFSGGLIPTYLTIRDVGILDSVWAVVLPGALSVYNMIVMRTYFDTQIPLELLESSQLDGCGNIRYLTSIVLPLSGPILAVTGLFYAVGYWNSYFGPMIYLNTRGKFPLAIILREILVQNNTASMEFGDIDEMASLEMRRNVMKYAVIVVSSLPVMLLYPFVQKYFVKGIMIGAVKG
ncbi:sugar ABC transporter permease [Clostridia bacterium]|nr:sugar ABC transporter permease [Clostridia bacterium]